MEIIGKIVQLLPLQTGQGKNGVWKKQDYVLEFGAQYPKKICFNIWGDKIDTFQLKEGEEVRVDFDVESREFNGRWYTDVRAWNITRIAGSVGAAVEAVIPQPDASSFLAQSPDSDMPF